MSLHPHQPDPVPDETTRIARAAFPDGNPYMRMRDELDAIYQDEQFIALFPSRGKPAAPPWRLALATIFQFAENLSDRQAADAVRARIELPAPATRSVAMRPHAFTAATSAPSPICHGTASPSPSSSPSAAASPGYGGESQYCAPHHHEHLTPAAP